MKKQVMKSVTVEVPVSVDCDDKGLAEFLGKRVDLYCVNYIYHGKLVGVNGDHVVLDDAGIVYETGPFTGSTFKDFQEIGRELRVRTAMIESYGPSVYQK